MEPTYSMPAEQAAEALMASMKLNGIDRLWFTSGTELAFFQEVPVKHQALGRPAPRIMTMTHENAALSAAMGETMITGKPSATAAHVECGMINAGGSIHNADRGHYPVLMMSGYPPSAETGSVPGARDAGIQWYQQIRDQGELVRQYMRWDHKLAAYDNPGTVITRAVQVMLSEPQGPAYLAVPREAAMRPMDGAKFPLLGQLPPARKSVADAAQLRQAAKWLLEAQRPMICASRVGRDPSTVPALVELAETLGAQVMADGYRVNIPADHPLAFSGGPMSGPPQDVDCFLILDMLVPWAMTMYQPGSNVRIITLATDPIHRMTTIYEYPSDLAVSGDAGASIPLLLEEVRSAMTAEQRERCRQRAERLSAEGRQRRQVATKAAEDERGKGHITAQWLSHQVGQTLDPDTIIVNELVNTSLFNRTRPGTQFNAGGSSLGWAGPAAVGAKVAAPDRQIVCCSGDGSWMFGNPQVVTWASKFHKAPVLFIISNNRGYSTGTTQVLRSYPEGYAARAQDVTGGWFDPCPNYSGEAAASGAYGEKVTDPEQVGPAIQRGLQAVREGAPAVLDMWLPKHVTGEL
ncbi:MAG: thiamine pyrophosphate-requiring protein [Chloroflexi bacterium]|nr:thiamine pyrophosphate-requiring protein [Chloroflexota bacterium]MBV9596569.1 thiamine pyrophosphate-requiring protein [Chloroflexota bacterium]